MRNTFINELEKLAVVDPSIYLLTGDLGFGVLNSFSENLPKQFINVGISEQNMAAVAAGLALEGNTVYTYSIGNFPSLRCLEQIRNDICYPNANVKIISVGAGLSYGQLGMSHHATEDMAIMRALPNMRVFSPADPQEAIAVLKEVSQVPGPAYIRLGKGREANNAPDKTITSIAMPREIVSGTEVCLFTTGAIAAEAVKAAQILNEDDISAAVYTLPAIKPIDADVIKKLTKQFELLVSIEEHNVIGGLGSAIAEVTAGISGTHAPLLCLGMKDQYSSIVGSHEFLRDYYGLSAEKLASRICDRLEAIACKQ